MTGCGCLLVFWYGQEWQAGSSQLADGVWHSRWGMPRDIGRMLDIRAWGMSRNINSQTVVRAVSFELFCTCCYRWRVIRRCAAAASVSVAGAS
jgi:hypothetical protein